MKVKAVINNYMLGAYLKVTPTDKITTQERIDKSHTVVIYTDVTKREVELIEKCFPRKVEVLEV